MKKLTFLLLIIASLVDAQQTNVEQFSKALDSIRIQLKIPGMAVAIKQGDIILLERGYGFADLEKHVPATAQTTFRVASVTKTFTSTLVIQLVEQGKLNLDDSVQKYGILLNNPGITVRHLLTHTSEEIPGTHFQYNGYRYGLLGPILEKTSGLPFYRLLMENILIPLKMTSSAPSINPEQVNEYSTVNSTALPFFNTAFNKLAKPYELTSSGEIKRVDYLNEFGAFGGLATSVGDLLKYSDAIDHHHLISEETQTLVFTPNRTNTGNLTHYGLGWFVQSYKGRDYYWHYGQTNGESALFIKVPSLKLTLAVMGNTDKLSQPFPLADGDLMMSPIGSLFYHFFIQTDNHPDLDLENKELISKASIAILNNDTLKAQKLYEVYKQNNKLKGPTLSGKIIAGIQNVGIDKHLSHSFTLAKSTAIQIVGVGENCSGNSSIWCDYGWIEDLSGKIVWQMQNQPSSHAGGAQKNQKVNRKIILQPGDYTLHYQSDSGHAYNHWDSLPPDDFFWGIILLENNK